MFKRKKKLCRGITLIFSIALIGLILVSAVLIARKDVRFAVKQKIQTIGASVELSQVKDSSLENVSVNISDNNIQNIIENQSLMLVNYDHVLDKAFKADICEYKESGVKMNSVIIDAYKDLANDVYDKYNRTLYIMSAYRTAQEQSAIRDEQGAGTAMTAGSSEHETGLAVDVYVNGYAGRSLIKTDAGQYVNSNCWEYGFIIRYPLLKKSITQIEYEPWHLRYVGFPHAEIISKSGITLEEYFDYLEYDKFYSYDNYVISRQKGDKLEIPNGENVVISSDNCGGYIITVENADI